MSKKAPFITVKKTAHNFTMTDCEFYGDKPTLETAAKNTKLTRIKHFGKVIKENPIVVFTLSIISTVIATLILRFVFQI